MVAPNAKTGGGMNRTLFHYKTMLCFTTIEPSRVYEYSGVVAKTELKRHVKLKKIPFFLIIVIFYLFIPFLDLSISCFQAI